MAYDVQYIPFIETFKPIACTPLLRRVRKFWFWSGGLYYGGQLFQGGKQIIFGENEKLHNYCIKNQLP